MASVAAQLARSVPLNAGLLTKRKRIESYLFTSRSEIEAYDLDAIHSLAKNGFEQLSLLDPAFGGGEWKELIGEESKEVDRTLLGREEEERVNELINGLLERLGPWVLEGACAKVLEWLVRRYRCVSRCEFTLSS
jgi:U3 small nucleolar RNA-associated protein 10